MLDQSDIEVLKKFTAETHRTISPTETLARVKPYLREMGITRIANVTGLDRIGIPVVMVTRPNSRSVAVSQGKGLTYEAAAASGLMETIETWHAERIQKPLILSSYRDISQRQRVANVDLLPKVLKSNFKPDLRLLWIEGHDLMENHTSWLPYEMVHTDYTDPVPSGHGCFECSTNGLASGNHILEAQCHAICELIERDSITIWHHLPSEKRAKTLVSLDAIDDEFCRKALEQIADADLSVRAWYISSDIEVPTFYCVIFEPKNQISHIGVGSGCHPTKGIALLRALTEAVQTRMTYISGARDDIAPEEFTDQGIQQKHKFLQNLLSKSENSITLSSIKSTHIDDFESEKNWLLERLSAVGIKEAVCVNLSLDRIGIPVVRMVIPGLEAPNDEDSYVPGPRALAAERGEL